MPVNFDKEKLTRKLERLLILYTDCGEYEAEYALKGIVHHTVSDLGLDSIAVLEIIMDLEDELNTVIPDDAIPLSMLVEDLPEALYKLLPN